MKNGIFVFAVVAVSVSACTRPDEDVEIGPVRERCDTDPSRNCVGLCDWAGEDIYPHLTGCLDDDKNHPREAQFKALVRSKPCTEWRALLPTESSGLLIIQPQDVGIPRVIVSGYCPGPLSFRDGVVVEEEGERHVLPILSGIEPPREGRRVLSLEVSSADGTALLDGEPAQVFQDGSLLHVSSGNIFLTLGHEGEDN
jgi:hypothetical protein